MQVRLHSNLDGSSLAHAIQVPMGPLHYFRIILELERERTKEEKEREEVLHLFRCYTHTHTHTHTHTWRHGRILCVAGVALMALDWLWWRAWFPVDAVVAATVGAKGMALGDIAFHFAWQAWHLATATFTLSGRRRTSRLALCAAGHRLLLCVAGLALGDMDLHFAWQAWHLATWTYTLRGSRGAYGTGLALVARLVPSWRRCRHDCWSERHGTWRHRLLLCVAEVALGDMDLHFAWQAWHLVTWTYTLRGRRGTWRHRLLLCVAGVALGDMDLHFAWQAWHLATWTFTLRGRRGTWWRGRILCVAGVALKALDWLWWRPWFPVDAVVAAAVGVAGVALGDMAFHFDWPVWHLATSTFTLSGRRGTWWHGRVLCVVGVALGDMDLHFARQAWHLAFGTHGTGLALAARLVPVWRPSLSVASVTLADMDVHFAWQAWHLATSTVTLHGMRGTWWLCVAGVALMAHMALGWLWWRAWFPFGAVGAAAVCVAGVALGDIDLHFAWQAWHLSALGWLWWRAWVWRGRLRGRRGACWHRPSLCVAGVAESFSHPSFTFLWLLNGRIWLLRWPAAADCMFAFVVPLLDSFLLRQFIHYTHAHIHIHTHFHAQFYHTHTPHFYTLLHTLLSRTSLRHTFVSCISHPIFTFLLLLIGRSWHVGLSGPVISSCLFLLWPFLFFSFFLFVSYCSWTQELLFCFVLVDVLVVPLAVEFREWFDWNRYHLTAVAGTLQMGSCLNYLRRIGIGP